MRRRTTIKAIAGSLVGLTECFAVQTENRTDPRTAELAVTIHNETGEYQRGDLVVLNHNKSEVLGRDGIGWESGTQTTYRTNVTVPKNPEFILRIYLNKE